MQTKINFTIFATIASILSIIGCLIGLYFTRDALTFYQGRPIYHPPYGDGWNPIDGSLRCIILNHTYLERDDQKIIDVYAVVSGLKTANSTFNSTEAQVTPCEHHALRYYQEFLQSCRCHNASYVNRTIDSMFPINKTVDCSINDDCTQFRINYTGEPGFYTPSDEVFKYDVLMTLLWVGLVWAVIFLFISLVRLVILVRLRRSNYIPV